MNVHTLKAEFVVQLAKQIDPANSSELANIILQLMADTQASFTRCEEEKGTGDFYVHCDFRSNVENTSKFWQISVDKSIGDYQLHGEFLHHGEGQCLERPKVTMKIVMNRVITL